MRHDSKISRQTPPRDDTRQWWMGVIVVVATIVSFIGFARVSVGWTLVVSTVIFFGLLVFLWAVGGGKESD